MVALLQALHVVEGSHDVQANAPQENQLQHSAHLLFMAS